MGPTSSHGGNTETRAGSPRGAALPPPHPFTEAWNPQGSSGLRVSSTLCWVTSCSLDPPHPAQSVLTLESPPVGGRPRAGGVEAQSSMSRKGGPPSCKSLPKPSLPEGLGTPGDTERAAEAQTSRTALALVRLGGSLPTPGGKGTWPWGAGAQRAARVPTDGISLLCHHGSQVLDDLIDIQQVTLWNKRMAIRCSGQGHSHQGVLGESQEPGASLGHHPRDKAEIGLGSEYSFPVSRPNPEVPGYPWAVRHHTG